MKEEYTVDNYLNYLKNQLIKNNIIEYQRILSDIEMRMNSLLQVWNDRETRKGILLFAKEEAQFYLPDANIDIKSFVVTTIRNSLIESVSSSNYKSAGFEHQLKEAEIKTITSFAIKYFKKFNFEKVSNNLKEKNIDNCYLKAIKKYPLAWEVVYKAANLKSSELYFDAIPVDKSNFISLTPQHMSKFTSDKQTVLEDGMTATFNEQLCQMLEIAVSTESKGFFTDSFKVLTRNFEKTLTVIQYLLERNSVFVTFNYYLSNGYISVRKDLLRPMHRINDTEFKIKKMSGISKRHKKFLELKISSSAEDK